MSRKLLLVAFVVLCTASFSAVAVPAEEPQADQQKMMQEYMKLMSPGPPHDYFKGMVGKWDVVTTAWMTPGAEPAVSKGTSESTLIMGGRFLMSNFTGTMFGQPFEGIQIDGYDNFKKKYVMLWVDNSNTGFYFLEGTRDTTTGVLTETGEWPDPMTGGSVGVRTTSMRMSPDEYVFEMYMTPPGGKEFKSMENKMTRMKEEEAK